MYYVVTDGLFTGESKKEKKITFFSFQLKDFEDETSNRCLFNYCQKFVFPHKKRTYFRKTSSKNHLEIHLLMSHLVSR